MRRIILSAVVMSACLAMVVPAQAAIVADFVNPQAYSLTDVNVAGGIIVGDKLFDDFTVTTTKSVGAVAPGLAEIAVTGVYINSGGVQNELGLKFNSGWSAQTNQIADSTITFRVGILEPQLSQGFLIVDNSLWIDAYGASAGAIVSVSENVYLTDPRLGPATSVANKLVWYSKTSENTFDHEDFAVPAAEIWVVKDVIANGGVDANGLGHLSQFYNTFSQVPEPATLALLGLGGLAAAWRRKRR
jgi:hypothetical protein